MGVTRKTKRRSAHRRRIGLEDGDSVVIKGTVLCALILAFVSSLWADSAMAARAQNQSTEAGSSEGYYLNRKLQLRDLVESGSETAPDVGVQSESAIVARLQSIDFGFAVPRDLLARKLTDVLYVSPEVSRAILSALETLKWRETSEVLKPKFNEKHVIDIGGAKHVQVAIRSGLVVTVQKAFWKQLSDVDKVALLLHEAISLVEPPVCGTSQTCEQDPQLVRDFVGGLFQPQAADRRVDFLTARVFGSAIAGVASGGPIVIIEGENSSRVIWHPDHAWSSVIGDQIQEAKACTEAAQFSDVLMFQNSALDFDWVVEVTPTKMSSSVKQYVDLNGNFQSYLTFKFTSSDRVRIRGRLSGFDVFAQCEQAVASIRKCLLTTSKDPRLKHELKCEPNSSPLVTGSER